MTDVWDLVRFGNPLVDPVTGSALASPQPAFTVGGVAVDPTAVTLTIKKPDGTFLVYGYPSAGTDGTLTREAAGRYWYDVVIDMAGRWEFSLRGVGSVIAYVEGVLHVNQQRVVAT